MLRSNRIYLPPDKSVMIPLREPRGREAKRRRGTGTHFEDEPMTDILRPLVPWLACAILAGPFQEAEKREPGGTVASGWSKLPDLPSRHGWGYGASWWNGEQLFLFHYLLETELPMITAFDPKTRKWASLPEPPLDGAGRGRMTIPPPPVAVMDGRAFFPKQRLSFDFASRRWQKLPAAPLTCRAAVAAGGRVVACGYEGEEYKSPFSLAVWDPKTKAWEKRSDRRLQDPFLFQGMAWTGSVVLLWGTQVAKAPIGKNPAPCILDAVAYDPESGTWSTPPGMPHPDDRARSYYTGGAWAGDRLLFIGEQIHAEPVKGCCRNDGLTYDPKTGAWAAIPASPLKGRHQGALLWTGRKLILWSGGPCPSCEDRRKPSYSDAAAFDPSTGAWERLPDAPIPGRFPPCAAWAGDRLIVYGGHGERFVRAKETAWFVWSQKE